MRKRKKKIVRALLLLAFNQIYYQYLQTQRIRKSNYALNISLIQNFIMVKNAIQQKDITIVIQRCVLKLMELPLM